MTQNKIAVIGGGSWGTALASTFALNGNDVIQWMRNSEDADDINTNHKNTRYLGANLLAENLIATTDLKKTVSNADIVLIVVPTKAIREVSKQLNQIFLETGAKPIIGHATKGIERETFKRVSEMISEEIEIANQAEMFFISGPSHAESVVQKAITLVSIASANTLNAKKVQMALSNNFFRVYTNNDLIGSELSAAVKNVLAIAGGIIKGLEMSDNTQAAFITRGLVEIKRFGLKMGGQPETFDGLAGLGDLIVTATSANSRNFKAGLAVSQGKSIEEIEADMGMVVEGISTTKALYELMISYHIDMPISKAVYQVLYEKTSINDAIESLMSRKLISED